MSASVPSCRTDSANPVFSRDLHQFALPPRRAHAPRTVFPATPPEPSPVFSRELWPPLTSVADAGRQAGHAMESAAPDALSPEGVAALASFVIRPPRAGYSRRELGDKNFSVDDVRATRTDLELVNERGLRLQCSHFEPVREADAPAAPCVVYLHGNGSCRVEATMLLGHLIPYGLSLFAFDFSGSGRSDGEYISLGVNEKDDVGAVVKHLVEERKVPRVALWGHSMGAATALMYTGLCRPPSSVVSLVLDSPFSSFDKLADAMVAEMPIPPGIPRKLILSVGTRAVRRNVRERAGFDVFDIDPLAAVKKLSGAAAPPAFFLHGVDDAVVPSTHSSALHTAYPARDKTLRFMPGLQHDTPRPDDVLERVFEFLQRGLTDGGVAGVDYLVQLKARGNLCMVTSRWRDAIYLYTAALDALAKVAVGASFADAVGSGTPRRRHTSRRRWAPLRVPTMRFGRGSPSDQTNRFESSDPGEPGVPDDVRGSVDVEHGSSPSTLKPGRKPRGRAKSFMHSLRARISSRREGGDRRRNRSGRFSKVGADRAEEAREADPTPPEAPNGGSGLSSTRSSGDAALGDRNAGARPSGDEGATAGVRRLPRFSHDGWRRRRTTRSSRGPAGASIGSLGGLGFASRTVHPPSRAASVDLRALSVEATFEHGLVGGIASWPLDAPRATAALALLGNRSLARRKLGDFAAALADAEHCVSLDPTWIRGHLRRTAALKEMGRIREARAAAADGLKHDPRNAQLRALAAELDSHILDQAAAAPSPADTPLTAQANGQANGKDSSVPPTRKPANGWAASRQPVAAQQ